MPVKLEVLFSSPFSYVDFGVNKVTIARILGLQKISDQPVKQIIIEYQQPKNGDVVIVAAEEGKYYGLALFNYFAETCSSLEEGVLEITYPMIIEAMIYYGEVLWNDYSKPHPSIEPFRRASKGEVVKVKLIYTEPQH